MNRRPFGAFGVLAVIALSVGSCKSDPLSNADGNPAAVVTNFSHLNINVGDTVSVTASVLDARATPLAVPVTFSTCNNAVVTEVDSSYHPIPATSARAIVIAQTPAPSCVVVQGGGLSDTITVSALPSAFTGALSSTSLAAGDTLTITSTAELKFDVATVAVTFGGGSRGTIVSKSADVLKVLVPFATPASPLTIAGVQVTSYTPPLAVTLQTSTLVTQTGDRWAGDTSWQAAPNLTAMVPAPGGSALMSVGTRSGNSLKCPEVVLGNATVTPNDNSTGPCMLFRFDVTDTLSVRFRADWDGTASTDIDIYMCADSVVSVASFNANCFEDGGGGATGAKPQTTSANQFTAGPHWVVIELFGGPSPRTNYITILRQ